MSQQDSRRHPAKRGILANSLTLGRACRRALPLPLPLTLTLTLPLPLTLTLTLTLTLPLPLPLTLTLTLTLTLPRACRRVAAHSRGRAPPSCTRVLLIAPGAVLTLPLTLNLTLPNPLP